MRLLAGYAFLTLLALSLSPQQLYAQKQKGQDKDSLIRLLSADMARLEEINGKNFRRVEGNAVFLHNGTHLYCDTAFWNVDDEYIDAFGSVLIEQGGTRLTGDSLKYVIQENTAKFRGHLVQLEDEDANILRTNQLDYNTKDSVAVFYGGGAMKDKDGNVIESRRGVFESKTDVFTFVEQVEMFSDSLFFICDTLKYYSEEETAYFNGNTDGWYDENNISSHRGWYNRTDETFFFTGEVHILTRDYELWADSLFYDRNAEYSHLYGNVQLTDTVDNVIVLGDELEYFDTPKRAQVRRKPAVVMIEQGEEGPDSLFIAADTLTYFTMRMFEIDSVVMAAAAERLELASLDPIGTARSKNRQDTPAAPGPGGGGMPGASRPGMADGVTAGAPGAVSDTMAAAPLPDTTGMAGLQDSVSSSIVSDSISGGGEDTLAVAVPDTSEVIFIEAYHDVRVFRKDMQARGDSLVYTGIDSIARLYVSPVIWYDSVNQVTSDSMMFIVRNSTLEKGYLLSNSFVISEAEKGRFYNQIKSPEMIGYFSDGQISKYDAMGGVSAIFYIAEDSVINTVNKKDCKLMSAQMKDGNIQRALYFETVKSDAYPVRDLSVEEHTLKGFNWQPDRRPSSRYDVTEKGVRSSLRRQATESSRFPGFDYTAIYFGDYMKDIIGMIQERKPIIWLQKKM